jgi:hypothetical protein
VIPEPDVFNCRDVVGDVLRTQVGITGELALFDAIARVGCRVAAILCR